MSIKFGLLTNPAHNIVDEIKTILKLGFDYAEVGIELPGGAPEVILKNKKIILSLLDKFNSQGPGHTAWWIDFGNGYEIIKKSWIEEGKKNIDAAKLLNLKKINFHFYSVGLTKAYKAHHHQILKNIISSLRQVVKYADSKGITVMLENTPNQRSVIGIREYKFVIDSVPKLKAHIDMGHAFMENGMKGIKEYLFTFEDKIEHLHIHDNHGEFDEHLPLGDGDIDFNQIAKWLKEIKYDKTMTFEVFTSKKDARESMLKFKQILSE